MKKILILSVILLALTNCGRKGKAPETIYETLVENAVTQEVANDSLIENQGAEAPDEGKDNEIKAEGKAKPEMSKEESEAAIRRLISNLFDGVIRSDYSNNYVNTTYFTSEFVNIFKKVRKVEDENLEDGGDLDNVYFDTDFWTGTQDPGMYTRATVKSITLGKNSKGENTAKVVVTLSGFNTFDISLNMIETGSGWRISDYMGEKAGMQKWLREDHSVVHF